MGDRIALPLQCPKCKENKLAIYLDAESPGLLLVCLQGCDVAREMEIEGISEWGTLSEVCIPISQAEYQAELIRLT